MLAGCRREAKILSRVTVVLKIRSRTVKTLASVMLWMMHLLQQRLVKQLFLSLRQTARVGEKERKRLPIMSSQRQHPFKWCHFQADIILLCVRWYLRYALSYRDLEEMMLERGLHVDHTTIYRWVQQYAPELERRCRPHLTGTNARGASMRPMSR